MARIVEEESIEVFPDIVVMKQERESVVYGQLMTKGNDLGSCWGEKGKVPYSVVSILI